MLIFLDTETTGLVDARLVQIAYRKIGSDGTPSVIHKELFKPTKPIELEAMAVNHITNKMVEGLAPFEGSQMRTTLKAEIEQSVVVAHNAPFDIQVLAREGIEVKHYIDTRKCAMHLIDSDKYSLQYLRYFLGFEIEAVAHDAAGDVMILEQLFWKLASLIDSKIGIPDDPKAHEKKLYAELVNMSQRPLILKKVTFGQYAPGGKKAKADGTHYTWEELAKIDSPYLHWLIGSEGVKAEEEQNKDLMFTLNHYLNAIN